MIRCYYIDRKEHEMNLTDKKYIPYYITGAIIIILSLVIVFILSSFSEKDEPETTTLEITTEDRDGVPYYPDIPASAFLPEYFTKEDGRIVYTDNSVKYYTGIDVSTFQGDIDWDDVSNDGIDFAIIRIGLRGYGSKGSMHEDDTGRKNIEEALDAGLKVGVYFFSQAINTEEAIAEADFVLDIIKDYDIDYPVVFDWENEPGVGMRTDNLSDAVLTDCAVAFCERVKAADYTPAVYFNLNFGYLRYDLSRIKDYVFWYAQHEGEQPDFYYNYSIWQYSDCGRVDGIDGDVDMNISFNDFSK